jgi:hypothetical protein
MLSFVKGQSLSILRHTMAWKLRLEGQVTMPMRRQVRAACCTCFFLYNPQSSGGQCWCEVDAQGKRQVEEDCHQYLRHWPKDKPPQGFVSDQQCEGHWVWDGITRSHAGYVPWRLPSCHGCHMWSNIFGLNKTRIEHLQCCSCWCKPPCCQNLQPLLWTSCPYCSELW